jgi:hypothetical protein
VAAGCIGPRQSEYLSVLHLKRRPRSASETCEVRASSLVVLGATAATPSLTTPSPTTTPPSAVRSRSYLRISRGYLSKLGHLLHLLRACRFRFTLTIISGQC